MARTLPIQFHPYLIWCFLITNLVSENKERSAENASANDYVTDPDDDEDVLLVDSDSNQQQFNAIKQFINEQTVNHHLQLSGVSLCGLALITFILAIFHYRFVFRG